MKDDHERMAGLFLNSIKCECSWVVCIVSDGCGVRRCNGVVPARPYID